jgi:5-methylcytosine-specific restriction endonuclease McrA
VNPARADGRGETLAIPADIREAVDARDQRHCRVCGQHLDEARALHHIHYGGDRQGMGGRRKHDLDNLITVCWMWPGNCHDLVHSQKRLWLPVLEQLTVTPGVTGLQLRRWQAKRTP